MAKEIINVGQAANDGTGDPLRNAFEKVNSNFTELYDTADTQDLDFTGDSGTGAVELDSQTLNLVGTNGVQTTASGQTITIDTSSLDTRLTTAEADIDTNTASITTEETARIAADTTLQTNIDSEASTRASADTSEAATRLANDNTLQGNIDTEASTRATADTTLQTNIDAEATTRGSADTTLQTNIDSEAATRLANDNTLQSNIDAEAATRLANDNTLQGNIDTEASTRSSADTALQGQIDSNDTDIATNAANIATNTTNISSNDTDISGLDTRLTTAEGNITSNDTDITGLDNRLTTAEGNISSNDTDIATNAANIATNVTNIATNVTNIATNVTNIATNVTDIATNATDIATNVTNIASNDTDISNLQSSKQNISEKNQANGYAPLDSGAKIPIANLPDSVVGQVEYQGTWDASIDDPTLPSASTVKGHYYVVSVGGTYETITYAIGDWIISNGVAWEKIDNTDAVTTVFGRLGAIVANEGDYSSYYPLIADLTAAEADIATNATNISTNTSNISTNTSDIATNASNISSNDTDITALQNDKYDKTGGTITGNATITGSLIVDTNTLYVNSSTNNVGIGTDSPNNIGHIKTSVNGEGLTLQINSTTQGDYSQLSFVPSTADNTVSPIYIRGVRGSSLATSYLTLNTNSTEQMRIDSSGRVGINESNPTAGLHVVNSNVIGESIAIFESLAQKNGYVYINADDNRRKSLVFQSGGVDKFSMGVGDSDELSTSTFFIGAGRGGGSNADLVIDSSGNVGIGTAIPDGRLDISLDYGTVWTSSSRANPFLQITNSSTTAGTYSGIELISTGTGNAGAAEIVCIDSGSGSGDLAFSTRNLNVWGERMRIDSSGNVGIGTDSPDTQLHISSVGSTPAARIESTHPSGIPFLDLKGAAAGQIRYLDETGTIQTRIDMTDNGGFSFVDVAGSSSPRMVINSSGNVGIGETNPSSTNYWSQADNLVVRSNSHTGITIKSTTTTNGNIVFTDTNSSTAGFTDGGAILYAHGTDSMIFRTNGAERMSINSAGLGYFNSGFRVGGLYITALQGNAQLTNASTSSGSNPSYIGQGLISVTISDEKSKENFGIVEKNECLNEVVSLSKYVKKFDWIDEDWKAEKGRTIGMVAQEVEEEFSKYVHKPKNHEDDGWAIRYQEIVPTLIKAVQELKAEIETLKSQINK